MQLGVVGFSFKTLSLKEREEKLKVFHLLFSSRKGVLLSTCNRCEFYFSEEEFYWVKTKEKELFFCYQLEGLPSFFHLVRVTAGLESLLLGESEIHRQVKESYQKNTSNLPTSLHYFFQKALHIAKEIRSYFPEIQPPNMGRLIAEFLPKPYFEKKFAFLGNSRLNRQISAFFLKQGVETPEIYTRHAEEFSSNFSLLWKSWEEKEKALEADVLICASKVEKPIFYAKDLQKKKPLWIFDLGVPRNVCSQVEQIPGIHLFNVDSLSKAWNVRWTQALLQKKEAEGLLEEKAKRLYTLFLRKKEEKRTYCTA